MKLNSIVEAAEKFGCSASHQRGHIIIYLDSVWRYADTKEPAGPGHDRACRKCRLFPTPEGYDPCLGFLEDVQHACCGHGIENGYIVDSQGKYLVLPEHLKKNL